MISTSHATTAHHFPFLLPRHCCVKIPTFYHPFFCITFRSYRGLGLTLFLSSTLSAHVSISLRVSVSVSDPGKEVRDTQSRPLSTREKVSSTQTLKVLNLKVPKDHPRCLCRKLAGFSAQACEATLVQQSLHQRCWPSPALYPYCLARHQSCLPAP